MIKKRKHPVIHPCRHCFSIMTFRWEFRNKKLYGICGSCYKLSQKYFYDKEDKPQIWISDDYFKNRNREAFSK